MVFCFIQNFFFFQTTQELEYLFFLSRKAQFFPPEFNIRLYDKKSDYFLHQNQNIIFRKKNITPTPLEVKWSVPQHPIELVKSFPISRASRLASSNMNAAFNGAEFLVNPLCSGHCCGSHFGLRLFFIMDSIILQTTGVTVNLYF